LYVRLVLEHMADTKKEHYVPRCYLENFSTEQKRIDVFDKWKLEIRPQQKLMDVAMENGFYDLDLSDAFEALEPSVREKAMADLLELPEVESWEDIRVIMENKKYIEKEHFAKIEGHYSTLLKLIIQKSYNGNHWVLQNCNAMSESEKLLLSLFIAIQFIRTRSFRDNLGDMFEKFIEAMAYKSQMNDEDASPKDAFRCEVDPEYIKLQHSAMIIDPDMAVHFAETFSDHVWVVYYNKTDVPFYTSDSPVVNIPHKSDSFRSYAGFASEGIEIAFPLSRKLLLCMYDRNTIGNCFKDRQFYEVADRKAVEYYNMWQVVNCYRCVFSIGSDFLSAKKMCEDNPELQKYQSRVQVT